MTPAEAAELVATLRMMYPDGDMAPELAASYATLLAAYDAPTAADALARLMKTHTSRRMPTWAVVEHHLHAASPAHAAWHAISAALDAKTINPPEWPDTATRTAVSKMGGWGTFTDWDGSLDLLRNGFLGRYQEAVSGAEPQRPRLGEGEKHMNVTGDDRCPYCSDMGWVELKGERVQLGIPYPEGLTACRWCERGETLYKALDRGRKHRGKMIARVHLRSDYGEQDIADPPRESAKGITAAEYAATPAGQADPALKDPRVRDMIGLA